MLLLRQKTIALQDIMSSISQYSWRIKKANESNKESEDIYSLYWEYLYILNDFIGYVERNLGEMKDAHKFYLEALSKMEKGGEDEK